MNDVLTWIKNTNDWSSTNSYSKLDARANTEGGTLNSNWDAAKTANGIDHP
jgi:hypothetical protein